jgi:hypothetical protein
LGYLGIVAWYFAIADCFNGVFECRPLSFIGTDFGFNFWKSIFRFPFFIFYCPRIDLDLVKLIVMKNTVAFSSTLLCFLLFVQSCSKKSQDSFASAAQPDDLITASVNSGETYTLMVASSGTLTVTRQALHFQLSATTTDETGAVLYKYMPQAGYSGSDEVALMYSPAAAPTEHNGGCQSHSSDITTSNRITVKFSVNK